MKNPVLKAAIFFAAILILSSISVFLISKPYLRERVSADIVKNTWRGYKHYFITENGRVKRPREADTVSEGQAYAMLRAVWMGDKETFDGCYIWTEKNLSRKGKFNDNLLAWHWKDGAVSDWMPASDADIDYALSLIFASAKWSGDQPAGVEGYTDKAAAVLKDILRLETFETSSGRTYLSPWILGKEPALEKFPLNPSYYSPAHFRVFYKFSGDTMWLKLVDSAYYVLGSLSKNFNGEKGVGLIPDWCSVNGKDEFGSLEGKSGNFGWEAVRIPFRVTMDYAWFGTKEAKGLCNIFAKFADKEWREKGAIFCEYSYGGEPIARYESALFYSSYATTLFVNEQDNFSSLLTKARSYVKMENGSWYYQSKDEYYVNSLAWFSEGFSSKVIKNLY